MKPKLTQTHCILLKKILVKKNTAKGYLIDDNLREDVPLKSTYKSSRCFCSDDCFGGSKLISTSFGVLTTIITFALLLQIYYGDYEVVPHGSVATDSRECSEIGTSILKQGGNSIDSAIASAFCLAVVNPHFTGLDAEGQIIIYNHRTRETPEVIDFRRNENYKLNGPIPRLVIGMAYLHQQYGSISWKTLIEPSINLARRGFLVPKVLVLALKNANAQKLYGNLEPGQIITMPKLATTLENIALMPEEDLYNYITLESAPIKTEAVSTTFSNYKMFLPGAPLIGPDLIEVLDQISHHNFSSRDTKKAEYFYRLAQIAQTVYQHLNVAANFHEGTSSNVAVIDKDENYVSLISGLYQLFGSQEMTPDGYLLDIHNNNMTICTRVPLIIIDANFICGRRLVFGANNLFTATQIISFLLISKQNATTVIESPRYNLFLDGTIGFEDEHKPVFSDEEIEYLETLGLGQPVHIKQPYGSSNIVEKVGDLLNSHSDSRGGGIASRF